MVGKRSAVIDRVKKLHEATTSASSPGASSTVSIRFVVALLLLASRLGAYEEVPVAVAPGSATQEAIATPCPTFSWGRFEGAVAYELVVYRIGDSGDEPEHVLSERLPGSALVWTPSLDRCLPRGHRYAWSIWALNGDGEAGWSDPLLFEVRSGPSREEVAWAIDVVRRHLGVDIETSAVVENGAAGDGAAVTRSESEALSTVSSAGISTGNSAAQLMVVGEVRTVDSSGEPRLWGRGRVSEVYGTNFLGGESACTNGDTKFGLSTIIVDWGSAADACPAGTWVCRQLDLDETPCDTVRPDSAGSDVLTCDSSGVDRLPHNHDGWVADRGSSERTGSTFWEGGSRSEALPCTSLPVWCCWN